MPLHAARFSLLPAFAAVSALVAALTAMPAGAATATTDLAVSATVQNSCLISTVTNVSFGVYDSVAANQAVALDATGQVQTTCTSGAAINLALDQGAQPGTGSTLSTPLRRMISGSNYLSYVLYQDATYSTVWGGNNVTGLSTTGVGTAVNSTVYARVPAGQNVPAGTYTDTVVATVTF